MYVYIIQSGFKEKAPVKVGMSDDPNKRIKQLQTGNPLELRLLLSIKCTSRDHAYNLERTLHTLLSSNNIMNEWFSICKSNLYKAINDIANNPDFKQVENNVGLFRKPTLKDKSKAKKETRTLTVESYQEQNENLVKKNNNKSIMIEDMEKKMIQRKNEARIFRGKLIELGFKDDFDELLGR